MTAQDVVAAYISRGLTVATAESLTAGLVAATLADVPGASAMLRGGVVSYANGVKSGLLGVSTALLAEAGSVDARVAQEMAVGARSACGADYAVSTTGVAGPEAHDGKPVGTVFVGVAGPDATHALEYRFAGSRAEIREAARDAALAALLEAVS
ncbi:nicotinamide-nucleotide amidohydrolase family protein [Sinomonas sp. JGH33]|uniref:Nicotinamide-nucleotide amidohydrolase family protein n=1 Tax=Sinomonas terricola TaxID=3110330 RepID=A0ABU5T5Y6_9MICC|nr:nicotinamide-nucleotide amidohydrolase family protein [Sinomonas sp. JGH33]MEA5454551.1 nicotinamide-nucleotide amidohydrolase family protein [Sinomonas sp. JGH33]